MSRLAVSRLAGFLLLAGLPLASCGGGDSSAEPAEQGSAGADSARPAALSEPAVVLPAGSTADPGAMSDFTCVAANGRWSAAGTLTNTTASRASFLVTVAVAAPDAAVAGGRQQRIDGLAAGDSVAVRLSRLPAPAGDDADCQLQVLRW